MRLEAASTFRRSSFGDPGVLCAKWLEMMIMRVLRCFGTFNHFLTFRKRIDMKPTRRAADLANVVVQVGRLLVDTGNNRKEPPAEVRHKVDPL